MLWGVQRDGTLLAGINNINVVYRRITEEEAVELVSY